MRSDRRERWLVRIVLLLLSLRATGQSSQVQNWTTEEGLPQNSVHALLQSREGYLWLATEKGGARFDGLRFRRFSSSDTPAFPSDDICCMAETHDGLLFGTTGGLVELTNGSFRSVKGSGGAVLGLARDGDGSVVVLTAGGLQRWRAGSLSSMELPGGAAAKAVSAAADGSVLVVTDTELLRSRGAAFEHLGPVAAGTLQVVESSGHELWTATTAAVEERDARTRVPRRWQVGAALPGSRVESLQSWPGGVLVGTNRGAVILRTAEARPQPIAELTKNAVLSAMVDREGDAWFGTESGGLYGLRQRSVSSPAALSGESITAMASAEDGSVYAGTRDAGLRVVHAGERIDKAMPEHLASDVVLSLAADRDGLWVGSPEGLDHLQGGRVEHRTAADGLPDDFVRSVLATRQGTVWVGTRRGVAELRDGVVRRVLTAADGLPSEGIGAMLQDRDGSLWIGTLGGLVHATAENLRRVEPLDGTRLAITSLDQTNRGNLWVGTGQGLYLLQAEQLLPVRSQDLQGGIAAALVDRFANLWLRTSAGLLRAPEGEVRACAGQPICAVNFRKFGVADGLPSVELPTFGTPAGIVDRDGLLWFATRRGAAVVDPQTGDAAVVPPGIAVDEVRVDDRVEPFLPEAIVSAGKRRITISFAGLSLHAPGQVRFRYLLDGFDRDWSPWQFGNLAEYTNLPPGRFLFRVEAMNAEGVVSSTDATVRLRVKAPLHRRWWFFLLMLLLAGGAAYGIYWLRVRRVRRDFENVLQERNRIAREIHDTLAQDFVAVSLQLEVTSQLLHAGATSAAKEQVDATRVLVREGIQDARESIWAIRAGGAEQGVASRLTALAKGEARTSLQITGAYRALPPSHEREIFRIAKEAVGNAQKHSHAEHIRIELIYLEDAVVMRVSDDGAGFEVGQGTAKPGHYGLRGMQERAAAMGASLTVQSAPEHGTCLELRVED